MGGSAFNNLQQNIKDHEEEYYDDDLGFSSSSSSDDDGSSSANSSSSDLVEDGTTTTTTTTSSSSSIADHDQLIANNKGGPLDEMSSLMHQLPFKRGLSKFYQGKSQSFTSLSNVRSLEDLAKPENPYNKRLKSCRSYGGFFISENQHQKQSKAFSRAIAKKSSSSSRLSSCSSLSAKRSHSFLGLNRPPIAPQKNSTATTLCNQQTPLFV